MLSRQRKGKRRQQRLRCAHSCCTRPRPISKPTGTAAPQAKLNRLFAGRAPAEEGAIPPLAEREQIHKKYVAFHRRGFTVDQVRHKMAVDGVCQAEIDALFPLRAPSSLCLLTPVPFALVSPLEPIRSRMQREAYSRRATPFCVTPEIREYYEYHLSSIIGEAKVLPVTSFSLAKTSKLMLTGQTTLKISVALMGHPLSAKKLMKKVLSLNVTIAPKDVLLILIRNWSTKTDKLAVRNFELAYAGKLREAEALIVGCEISAHEALAAGSSLEEDLPGRCGQGVAGRSQADDMPRQDQQMHNPPRDPPLREGDRSVRQQVRSGPSNDKHRYHLNVGCLRVTNDDEDTMLKLICKSIRQCTEGVHDVFADTDVTREIEKADITIFLLFALPYIA